MATATETEKITDEQIQREVLEELAWDPRIRPNEIGVVAKDGVVALTGWVDSYTKRGAAEEKNVYWRLMVGILFGVPAIWADLMGHHEEYFSIHSINKYLALAYCDFEVPSLMPSIWPISACVKPSIA